MQRLRLNARLLPWLLAVALLAAQALTFAHELQHDLQLHDDPSCALHLYTKHAGQASAAVALAVVAVPDAATTAPESRDAGATPVLGYRTRAPPLSSSRSI